MKTLKFKQSVVLFSILLGISGCVVTQQPAPITDGLGASQEPTSSSAPYVPPYDQGNTPSVAQTSTYNQTTGSYEPSYAPVDVNAATHTVVRGDTVYNISKRYNISQENLRQWNNLADDTISVGQVLKVKGGAVVSSTNNDAYSSSDASPIPSTLPPSSSNSKVVDGITWIAPSKGRLATRFSKESKGINIVGQLGQPVLAAADGKVVYSDSGLDGYGNLIIVQHNSRYLTAYGNNQANLVKEGVNVKRGQRIATMGNTQASRVQLHFELRKDGQAVDPLRYIPGF